MSMSDKAGVLLETDSVSKAQWHALLGNFADATIFQTWEYGAMAWGERQLSHAILKIGGKAVAAAQMRIASRVPGVKHASLVYGPLWRTKGAPEDCDIFELFIKALVKEYVDQRRYSLTVYPFIHDGEHAADKVTNCLTRLGFTTANEHPRTLVLDTSTSLEDLEKNLRPRWRQYLRHARQEHLDVTIDTDHELLAKCLRVYNEMHERKGFKENVRMEDLLLLQQRLSTEHKLKVIAVGKEGSIDACVVGSAIGDTGLQMLAATTTRALENHASYLANWEMLRLMHMDGVHWFDLRGIDKESNPGGYTFKTGLSGKSGIEVCFLGNFTLHRSKFAKIMTLGIKKSIGRYKAAWNWRLRRRPRRGE